jgi:hypothetical protein
MADKIGTDAGEDLIGTDGDDLLDGRGGDDRLYGKGGNDRLLGGEGNDLLDGMTGADTMFGGAGDDNYRVDNVGDVVSEETVSGVDDGGLDIVTSTVTYTLGAFVERLTLTGTAAIGGTGNDLGNKIIGNGGANSSLCRMTVSSATATIPSSGNAARTAAESQHRRRGTRAARLYPVFGVRCQHDTGMQGHSAEGICRPDQGLSTADLIFRGPDDAGRPEVLSWSKKAAAAGHARGGPHPDRGAQRLVLRDEAFVRPGAEGVQGVAVDFH